MADDPQAAPPAAVRQLLLAAFGLAVSGHMQSWYSRYVDIHQLDHCGNGFSSIDGICPVHSTTLHTNTTNVSSFFPSFKSLFILDPLPSFCLLSPSTPGHLIALEFN
mmetsp:Transcript_52299/g.156963  ORF Transcript_52299/g.156963 Transcript_52299/m.156963 type:complete len:107 (-) Transcript_52299:772-1092(-)